MTTLQRNWIVKMTGPSGATITSEPTPGAGFVQAATRALGALTAHDLGYLGVEGEASSVGCSGYRVRPDGEPSETRELTAVVEGVTVTHRWRVDAA